MKKSYMIELYDKDNDEIVDIVSITGLQEAVAYATPLICLVNSGNLVNRRRVDGKTEIEPFDWIQIYDIKDKKVVWANGNFIYEDN